MHMKSFYQLEEKWVIMDEESYDKIPKSDIDSTSWDNLASYFPQKLDLSPKEKETLNQLEQKERWTGNEFLTMRLLQKKRGISESDFEKIQVSLRSIQLQLHKKGLVLPKWFSTFFESYDYLSRFRFDTISFQIWQGVLTHPKNAEWLLIPLVGDSQGFAWWGMIINSKGESIISYQDVHWEEAANQKEFRCADSIEEFLFRMSQDLIHKEKTISNSI